MSDLEEKQLRMINDLQLFLKDYDMGHPQYYFTAMILTAFLYGLQNELSVLADSKVDLKVLLSSSSRVLKKIQQMVKEELSSICAH